MTAPAPLIRHAVDGLGVIRRRPDTVDPSRPAVVIVHGAMDRAASFGRAMRRLGDIDVCAYDRRGYATSIDSGIAATLDDQATDLATIADWTGAASVVVVGHSLGGTIAMRLAETQPDAATGLGVFESPVPTLSSYRSDGADLALAAADRDGPAAAAEAFYRLVVGDAVWERLRTTDRELRRAEGVQLVAELEDLRQPTGSPDPSAVKLPVVVGAGGASLPAWRDSARELATALPDATYVELAGAGHGAHLTHPDEFARYVRSCVDTPTDGSGGRNPERPAEPTAG